MDQEVLNLLKLAAPERSDEFDGMWDKYKPAVVKASDRSGFVLEANNLFIQSTDRTILTIWLLGWTIWKEMYCWATSIALLASTRKPFVLDEFQKLDGQTEAYAEVDTLYAASKSFLLSASLDMSLWPGSVPKPPDILSAPKEDQFVNDLVHHTVAFFYLHELRHFILAQSGSNVLTSHEEELECDRWASEYLLGKAEYFKPSPPVEPKLIKSKRAMGVALGAAVMAHVQESGLWEATRSHPPIAERFVRLGEHLDLGTETYFWNVACTFALASLRRKNTLPARIEFRDEEDLFIKLLALKPPD